MDEIKKRVLFLLADGWENFEEIQDHLGIDDEDMSDVIDWLEEEEFLVPHTIH